MFFKKREIEGKKKRLRNLWDSIRNKHTIIRIWEGGKNESFHQKYQWPEHIGTTSVKCWKKETAFNSKGNKNYKEPYKKRCSNLLVIKKRKLALQDIPFYISLLAKIKKSESPKGWWGFSAHKLTNLFGKLFGISL